MANTESVPDPENKYHRDVFVTHCEADRKMAYAIHRKLKAKNFSCGLAKKNFEGGLLIRDQIITAIEESKKILSIVSKEALQSFWCAFELTLTLERTTKDGIVAIIPVVLNIKEDDLDPVLRQFECIHVDGEEVTDKNIDAICNVMKGPDVSIGNLLPVGNVGRGLAWSYFTSFLDIVFKDIQEAMDAFEKTKELEKPGISRKVYLLLPENCACPRTLTEVDPDIVKVDVLRPVPVEIMRAGKPRMYNNAVYKITKDSKDYHFVAECCSVVAPMKAMEEGQIARLTLEEKFRQVLTFKQTLDDILYHTYPGLCRIIRYKDNDEEGPKQQLLNLLEEECREEECRQTSSRPTIEMAVQGLSIDDEEQVHQGAQGGHQTADNSLKKSAGCYDVFIVNGDGDNDRKFARKITKFLEKEGKTCATKNRDLVPGGSWLDDMGVFTKRSKKIIVILSDETTAMEMEVFSMLITPDLDKFYNSVQPIPVLRELKKKKKSIEEYTKTLTYIDSTEVDFKERLLKAVNAVGTRPPYPAGEIAPGFAWSYFYGYLLFLLPGLKDRIKSSYYDHIQNRVSHKMYLFIPKSGRMLDKLGHIPGVEEYDQVKWEQDVAGNLKRSYNSVMYKVWSSEIKEDWYFVGEYMAPLAVLKDMEEGGVAGMSTEARLEQVSRLYSRLEEILSHEQAAELRGRWRLFSYDEDSEGLARLSNDIIAAVKKDKQEDNRIQDQVQTADE